MWRSASETDRLILRRALRPDERRSGDRWRIRLRRGSRRRREPRLARRNAAPSAGSCDARRKLRLCAPNRRESFQILADRDRPVQRAVRLRHAVAHAPDATDRAVHDWRVPCDRHARDRVRPGRWPVPPVRIERNTLHIAPVDAGPPFAPVEPDVAPIVRIRDDLCDFLDRHRSNPHAPVALIGEERQEQVAGRRQLDLRAKQRRICGQFRAVPSVLPERPHDVIDRGVRRRYIHAQPHDVVRLNLQRVIDKRIRQVGESRAPDDPEQCVAREFGLEFAAQTTPALIVHRQLQLRQPFADQLILPFVPLDHLDQIRAIERGQVGSPVGCGHHALLVARPDRDLIVVWQRPERVLRRLE